MNNLLISQIDKDFLHLYSDADWGFDRCLPSSPYAQCTDSQGTPGSHNLEKLDAPSTSEDTWVQSHGEPCKIVGLAMDIGIKWR